jgi:hypothetical protein
VNLLQRLLHGVRDFLQIEFAHNVESVLWHDISLLVNRLHSPSKRCS